jgi:hypothetical protein
MAKYPVRLSTMQDVREHYYNVKPIRGTTIRPIGCRGRKWEEIRKVDDNTFILGLDDGYGRNASTPYIEWREDAKGHTEVTIMNGVGQGAHCSVYTFHDYFLPLGMDLAIRNGRQFIRTSSSDMAGTGGDYLPKGNSYEDRKPLVYSREAPHKPWKLKSDEYSYNLPRKVVDKERKAKYKEGIKAFVEWAWIMKPIIGDEYETSRRYDRWKLTGMRHPSNTFTEGPDFMTLLTDPTCEERLDILCEFICQVNENAPWRPTNARFDPIADPKKFRSKLNSFINKYGHFVSTVN